MCSRKGLWGGVVAVLYLLGVAVQGQLPVVKLEGIFPCGVQAGLSNPNKCYLGTRVSDNEVIEEFITK